MAKIHLYFNFLQILCVFFILLYYLYKNILFYIMNIFTANIITANIITTCNHQRSRTDDCHNFNILNNDNIYWILFT
jgi:hypothetical protein